MIADIWSGFDPGVIGWVILSLVALAIFAAALFAALNGGRQFFGRKPTIDEDFRSQQKTLEELRQSLSGLAPNEKITELVSKLGQFATQDQIRKIELALPELIKREELTSCIEKIEREHDQQLKELRAYVHQEVHNLRNDIGGMRLDSTEAREGMHNRMHVFSEVLFEMRGLLIAIREGNAR